jgi:hypothetical protein
LGFGNRKWEKVILAWAIGSAVVEHFPHHPKLRVSFQLTLLVPVDKNWLKVTFGLAISVSTVAEHFPCHPKDEGSIPGALPIVRERKCQKVLMYFARRRNTVVKQLTYHPKVEDLSVSVKLCF